MGSQRHRHACSRGIGNRYPPLADLMRKPAPLQRGDVIGIVSPAAAVDELHLTAGVRVLEDAGFQVRLGAATLKKAGYLAGSDQERLADLLDMFRDPLVKAIIATRGGYGSGRLLQAFDPAVATEN